MIEIKRHSELSGAVKEELDKLIQYEFGHIPIVQETKWAIPDWTIIYYEDNEIATFYNIIERRVTIEHSNLSAAGINNVITPAKFRGKGFSTRTLRDTEHFIFDNLKSDLGLLLCADDLVPFYKRLNWYKVHCPVYFDQPGETKLWPANTMLLTRRVVQTPKEINLNGLPW
jgi:hypothetical protein